MTNHHLPILIKVSKELGPINHKIVYTGGSIISLLIEEPQFVTIRETIDVDCITQVSTRKSLEEILVELRSLGFSEDMNSNVICRYRKKELIIDFMPTDPKVLGFSNIWYNEGFNNSITAKPGNHEIQILTAPYFIATKIEAFTGRGKNSFLISHDIEDIISILDGRPSIVEEVLAASKDLKLYLKSSLSRFLNTKEFISSLEAHISRRNLIKERKSIILQRLKSICN